MPHDKNGNGIKTPQLAGESQRLKLHWWLDIVPDAVSKLRATSVQVDPKTGFLDHKRPEGQNQPVGYGSSAALCFSAKEKIEFLAHLEELWPNVTEACLRVGIIRQTFQAHCDVDRNFKMAVMGIIDAKMDQLESHFWKFAASPKGFMDRMVLAKAYRPERFDPEKKVRLTHQTAKELTDAEASEIANRASMAVDAEIVREQFRDSVANDPPVVGALGQGSSGAGE